VDQALQASERQLAGLMGTLGRVTEPLKAAGALVAPIRAQAGLLAGLVGLLLAALIGFTLLYALIGVVLAVTRGRDAARAFQTGGPVGYLGFVYSFLLMDGLTRLLARAPARAPALLPAELQARVEALGREVAHLRAQMAPVPPLRAAS
jgi:hypothetical protein